MVSAVILGHNAPLVSNLGPGYSRHDETYMTTEDIGQELIQARKARGLTLRDVERDTRISGKYLQALEDGRLEILPAPVYARAFMRTYAQYLGLDAASFVQQLPGARPDPVLPPLPDVGREATTPLISASWAVAGVVIVVLFVIGMTLFWNRGGGSETQVVVPPVVEQPTGLGAEQPTVVIVEPRPPLTIQPGVTPNLETEHVLVAITALEAAGMRYIVIEVVNEDVAEGVIFQQSPSPGTLLEADTVITIVAARSGP